MTPEDLRNKAVLRGIRAIEKIQEKIGVNALSSAIAEWANDQYSFWKNNKDTSDNDLAEAFINLEYSATNLEENTTTEIPPYLPEK